MSEVSRLLKGYLNIDLNLLQDEPEKEKPAAKNETITSIIQNIFIEVAVSSFHLAFDLPAEKMKKLGISSENCINAFIFSVGVMDEIAEAVFSIFLETIEALYLVFYVPYQKMAIYQYKKDFDETLSYSLSNSIKNNLPSSLPDVSSESFEEVKKQLESFQQQRKSFEDALTLRQNELLSKIGALDTIGVDTKEFDDLKGKYQEFKLSQFRRLSSLGDAHLAYFYANRSEEFFKSDAGVSDFEDHLKKLDHYIQSTVFLKSDFLEEKVRKQFETDKEKIKAVYSDRFLQLLGLCERFSKPISAIPTDEFNNFMKQLEGLKDQLTCFKRVSQELQRLNLAKKDDIELVKSKFNLDDDSKQKIKDFFDFHYETLKEKTDKEFEKIQAVLGEFGIVNRYAKDLQIDRQEAKDPSIVFKGENNPPELRNLGNTCYFNSLMQILFSNKALKEAIIESGMKDKPGSVMYELAHVLQYQATGKSSYVSMKKLLDTCYDTDERIFKKDNRFSQQDVGELLVWLIEKSGIKTTAFESESVYRTVDKAETLSSRKEELNCLSLHLEDSKKDVKLTELLDKCSLEKVYSGTYKKDDGEILSEFLEQVTYKEAPKILSIQVMRHSYNMEFKFSKKISSPVELPKDGVFSFPFGGNVYSYKITGMVTQIGNSINNGHYVADVFQDGKYFHCNDNCVSEIAAKEFYEKKDAYFIFAERMDEDQSQSSSSSHE